MTNIYYFFEASLRKSPDHPCIVLEGATYTYGEIEKQVDVICKLLLPLKATDFIGIFSDKSIVTYTGILAILKLGYGYVPINPKFPAKKNASIVEQSAVNTIIADQYCVGMLENIVGNKTLNIVCPDLLESGLPQVKCRNCKIYTIEQLCAPQDPVSNIFRRTPFYAYLLFTSGSTGQPKGVPVSHSNVANYVNNIIGRYSFASSDRFSQVFDLTFDLSVHDMFVCFAAGATLCIPPRSVFSPVNYIVSNRISVWFSVPSMGMLIVKSNIFNKSGLQGLKYIFFCGEPLPLLLVSKWLQASPASQIVNLYGPTETTIAISHYRCSLNEIIKEKYGFVSIGKVFDDQKYIILKDDGDVAKRGEAGELLLSGLQVVKCYWNNEKETGIKFIQYSGSKEDTWYKTGDVVICDEDGDLFYVTRTDFQVKVRGYRVELEEIDSLVRKAFNIEMTVSLAIPDQNKLYDKIFTFIEAEIELNEKVIRQAIEERLPPYMIPDRIIQMKRFPLNVNGKIDRGELLNIALKNPDIK